MGQRPPLNIDVTVDDGKYRFTQDVKGGLIIYRHGEEWMVGSFPGVNMVIAMVCELEASRKAIIALADGADKCAEAPHFIVQPFLKVYREHGETIAEARKAVLS